MSYTEESDWDPFRAFLERYEEPDLNLSLDANYPVVVAEKGINAITHLAAALGGIEWPDTGAARMVRLINDLVSLGDHGEAFGELAHSHPFLGPLTLTLAQLTSTGSAHEAGSHLYRSHRARAHDPRAVPAQSENVHRDDG